MMKPKAHTEHDTSMLDYLEDIIGTSRFKVCCSGSLLYLLSFIDFLGHTYII